MHSRKKGLFLYLDTLKIRAIPLRIINNVHFTLHFNCLVQRMSIDFSLRENLMNCHRDNIWIKNFQQFAKNIQEIQRLTIKVPVPRNELFCSYGQFC